MKNFNLNLFEFLDRLNEERVPWTSEKTQHLFEQTMHRIEQVISLDLSSLQSVNFGYSSTAALGRCGFGSSQDGKLVQGIDINERLQYDGLEDVFINNVCHEFCHYILNVQMYDKGYIIFEDGKVKNNFPSKEVEDDYLANDGHGRLFLELADEISKKLNLKYPITSTVSALCHAAEEEINGNHWTYKIYCDRCGNEIKFYTVNFKDFFFEDLANLFNGNLAAMASFYIDLYEATFENSPNNACNCGGCLRFAANKGYDIKSFKQQIDVVLELLFFQSLMGKNWR